MAEPLDVASAAERFLPHRHPAHLVTRVLESTDDHLTCVGRFPGEHPMAEKGQVAAFLAIEPCAQAAAAHLAVLATQRGVAIDQLDGFLTGAKNVRMHRASLPVDTDLQITVTPRGSGRGLYRFAFELGVGGALACEGELSTFVHTDLS